MNNGAASGFPVRCLAYTSRAAASWSPADLRQLANAASDRNQTLAVTGRLLFVKGRFIQVLEGPGQTPHDLFQRIHRDERHSEVLLLFDTQIEARSFPGWNMDLLIDDDLPPGQTDALLKQVTLGPNLHRLSWQVVLASIRDLEKPKVGPNVIPNQLRATQTVERLLDAAGRVLIRDGAADLTMRMVAAEANIAVSSAYRYFSTTEQILTQIVRRWQMRQIASFTVRLSGMSIASEAEAAQEIVEHVVATYLQNDLIPLRIRQMALRDYHRIAFAELWGLADVVVSTLVRNGLPPGDAGQRGRIAMALAGLGAQAKMAALNEPWQIKTASFRAVAIAQMTLAMRGEDRAQ